jgi:hypothetical protein
MTDDSRYCAEYAFAVGVLSFYTRLTAPESHDLGGRLLYAGELDEEARGLISAANVAGAASLCGTSDPDVQRHATRDGIVDFVVTSLDEALRILKNEIRKRTTVAVCVGASPATIEKQMAERGVAPDILRPAGAWRRPGGVLVTWSVASAAARWMPKLDAWALECLDPEAEGARRWLRVAPRYLGRLAQSTRVVQADRRFASRFMERVKELEGIAIPVRIQVTHEGGSEEFKSASWTG